MARKLCTVCNIRPSHRDTSNGQNCIECDTEGGWENTHSDSGHDLINRATATRALTTEESEEIAGCWICYPELNEAQNPTPRRVGHTNTVARSHTSHAACTHPATPKDRATCRKAHTWTGTAWV
jgi:hypothetical protein